MQISAKADYAVRALTELAVDRTTPLTCEAIASAQDIPFRFLKSVFRDLRRAGLVRSQRGCEGGYWIERDPAEITVAEVMTAVDGEFFTVHGEVPTDLRHSGAAAGVARLWQQLAATAHERLGATSLADLAHQAAPGTESVAAAVASGAVRAGEDATGVPA